MEILSTIFYFLVTIAILVFIHELGHFIAAKMCGMRVERFSIGFPPRLIGKRYGETDYMIGLIPLGGYVKISGIIDESMDTEHRNRTPQPWEFRSKPIYQRMFVISAGVLMNALLAVLIFWGLNYTQGKSVQATTEVGYVHRDSPAEVAGLIPGDNIISINNKETRNWDTIVRILQAEAIGRNLVITVERENHEIILTLPAEENISSPQAQFGIVQTHTRAMVNLVLQDSPALKLGLEAGDILLSIQGIPITNDLEVISIVSAHPEKEIYVEWERKGEVMSGYTTPDPNGLIGIQIGRIYTGPSEHINYSLVAAFPEGVRDMFDMLNLLLKSLWMIITGTLSFSENIAGPIMIAQIASQTAEVGLVAFLSFLGLLSITLAFINILPFPVLDGGHMMILTYELIFRREMPPKIQITIQQIGFVVILAFMAFVIYNDIARL